MRKILEKCKTTQHFKILENNKCSYLFAFVCVCGGVNLIVEILIDIRL